VKEKPSVNLYFLVVSSPNISVFDFPQTSRLWKTEAAQQVNGLKVELQIMYCWTKLLSLHCISPTSSPSCVPCVHSDKSNREAYFRTENQKTMFYFHCACFCTHYNSIGMFPYEGIRLMNPCYPIPVESLWKQMWNYFEKCATINK
jgi:hypothetical protein